MAAEKYTKPSSDSVAIPDAPARDLTLEFPEGEGFSSPPPLVPLSELIRRSHQLRQWFPTGLRPPAERWQAKTTVEFHL